MIQYFRKSRFTKPMALTLAFFVVGECATPGVAYALTGGPSQPEVQSFTPIGTSDMVDPFSGDFSYNIPLVDVGGYPINLSYTSGVSMDQEASWVGLGWNINPGVIMRNMRGLPDDFNGEEVKKEFNMRSNQTYGVTWHPLEGELFGLDLKKLGADLGFGLGVTFNNYNGIGLEMSLNPSVSVMSKNKSSMNAGLGLSVGSESGVGITPTLSFSKKIEEKEGRDGKVSAKVGLPFNSRAGLQSLTLSTSVEKTLNDASVRKGADKVDEMLSASYNSNAKDDIFTRMTGVANGGSSISFTGATYTPKLNLPMINSSVSLSLSLGGEFFGGHPATRWDGYFSGQYLLTRKKSTPAFGYLNLHNGQHLLDVMMDFNREKDGAFTENTPALPLAGLTFDVYSVSGQGIGGMYRPHRSEIGYVFDNIAYNYSTNLNLPAIELGLGNAAHPGTNFAANFSMTTTGKWEDDNQALPFLRFRGNGPDLGLPMYEAAYFQQAGEKAVDSDPAFFEKQGGFDPIRVAVYGGSSNTPAMPYFQKDDGTNVFMTLENYRKQRVRRNEAITFQNAGEASTAGVSKRIEVYDPRPASGYALNGSIPYPNKYKPYLEIGRVGNGRNTGHISEVSTYRADGARYVYGIPAYNYTQHDVTFSIMGGFPDCKTGLVYYNHGTDNSLDNDKGQDEYYERTTMPAYAHSYLLTSILTPDYVDLKNDGLTDDDLGGYTKINYSRALVNDAGNPADPANYLYQWRVPFEANRANYNEGFKSIGNFEEYGDDKASYIYGTKELWYMHSIETKTHIAEFHVSSDRKDGYGVGSEAGGIDPAKSNRMRKLDKIVLYAKEDRLKNGDNAIPIKTVHFVYDYSLCDDVGNNIDGTGKLTLKEVYFTYGNSKKSSLSGYKFTYSQVFKHHDAGPEFNPKYNLKGYDRWGNFKDNAGSTSSCTDINGPINTSEFPYVDQDKFTSGDFNGSYKADVYAAAWALTTIDLPSGGTVNITYEADDYAFVQNKRAMQMFKVVGATATSPAGLTSASFSTSLYTLSELRDYLVFKLEDGAEPCLTKDDVWRRYFSEQDGTPIRHGFFRFLMNLKFGKYEYVSGYATFEDCGIISGITGGDGRPLYGWVKVKPEDNYHPVSLASWNFMKLHLPRLAYNQPTMNDNGVIMILKSLASMMGSIAQLATGFNTAMRLAGNGTQFAPEKSFIRLYNPTYAKKGGGSRVKRVTLNDNWKKLLSNDNAYQNFVYGQEYDYTTTDDYGRPISSGVASYEPMLGGEENPFRQPVFFKEDKILAPDEEFYQETPYGESYFPSPCVGYSKVTIRNVNKDNPSAAHKTGKTVKEFYTARDFPTITRQTSLWSKRFKPRAILRLLKTYSQDNMAASQGFVIELNDMHGKPKADAVYAEGKDEPISGMEYHYKLTSPGRLDNQMMTMMKDKSIQSNMVGVDCDMTVDFRQSKTNSHSGGLGGNLDAFLAFILPVAIPVVLPNYAFEGVGFKSSTVTKVINRYGILVSTTAHDLGSYVATDNLMLDGETGEVLLTKTTNEFNDPLYSFNYPAHWSYDGMGPAYKNLGYSQNGPVNLNATFNGEDIFVPGDEVLYSYINSLGKPMAAIGTIVEVDGYKQLMEKGGFPFNPSHVNHIKIIRSGRRNQQKLQVGNVVSMNNPIQYNAQTSQYDLKFDRVINASATEFGEGWPFFCECEIQPGRVYNPYTLAFSGIWRQKKTWAFLTNRTQTRMNENTNVRRDGVFESFVPFWNNTGNTWQPGTDARWQYVNNVTIYSPQGYELENKDPLNRYSAALYGYKDMLPVAVSGNAEYREIGFDGFEDYGYQRCEQDHFSYNKTVQEDLGTNLTVTEKHSHTGRRSLRIKSGYNAVVNKKITRRGTGDCTNIFLISICPEEEN